jgi:transposase
MRRVLVADYEQMMLLAPAVEDWIGPRHPARFIREFVAALDLVALGLDTLERNEGGTAHDPVLLLQAWLYGYLRKIRSSRALEAACREEMGFVWLTGNHQPDHHALWRFWHEHREGIRAVFRQSVQVALELQLVGLVVQALDGTKIAAAASGRGGFDRAHLRRLLERLETQIGERERQIAAAGEGPPGEELPPLLRLREQVQAALRRVESGETKHAHPLEPDAARMECDGRNRFGYNAQAVVDTKEQIIVATEVTAAASDAEQLVPLISAAHQTPALAEANPLTLADGSYANGAQLAAAEQCGYPVLTPPPPNWRDTVDPFHPAHFRHDAARQVVVCPQGRELPLRGTRQKDGRPVEEYRDRKVCAECPVRAACTRDRRGRAIYISREHALVVAAHARWQTELTRALYRLRSATVEPLFAQFKQQMGVRRWSFRGRENVRTVWSFLATTWNLRVILRHWSGETGPTRAGVPPVLPRRGLGAAAAAVRTRLAHFCSLLPSSLSLNLRFLARA